MQALEKYTVEKDIAKYVKKEFDAKYTPTWHCVVGKSFGRSALHCVETTLQAVVTVSIRRRLLMSVAAAGSFVTHEAKHFTYFYLGELGSAFVPQGDVLQP